MYFQGLRISSTQNGLQVLIRSLKNDFEEKQRQMKAALKEKTEKNPAQAAALKAEYDQKIKEMRKELKEKIRQARTNALESSVEKSKCVEKYREKRKAELTAAFEADSKTLSGQALEERKARYEQDMKVAAKDNIMTKMQMIFQDPIASINPRMTVRECWIWLVWCASTPTAIRMSSPAASASVSALPAPSCWSLTSSSPTNPFPRWTCRFRHRLSTC